MKLALTAAKARQSAKAMTLAFVFLDFQYAGVKRIELFQNHFIPSAAAEWNSLPINVNKVHL